MKNASDFGRRGRGAAHPKSYCKATPHPRPLAVPLLCVPHSCVPPGTEVRGPFRGHWPQKEARIGQETPVRRLALGGEKGA